jgi:4-amino-4-deoxy-L-arabinose transferase-like glycosyltransferase
MRSRLRPWEWGLLAAITLGAAALRLWHLGAVSPDPFYDAAVRSMGLSFHNFFFGAFEPGGSVSIDKPPVDLWMQVASVKLLGFSSTSLKLPEALAGTASVPLLFLVVRRIWNQAAGFAAAVSMAVLPVEVITSRSDTMDAVMMTLIVLALLLAVRAAETGRTRWLLAAAAALGVAFDVKLLETVVALPALGVFALLGMPGTPRRRLLQVAAAGAVYVVVALSWLTATLFVPAHERPFAIGSTNGSAWNAAFVFNGTDRLGGKSPEPQFTVYEPGHKYPTATQSERDHIPIVPASPTRLLARIGPLSGERLGLELLIGLLLGIPALLLDPLLRSRRTDGSAPARPGGTGADPEPPPAASRSDGDGGVATVSPPATAPVATSPPGGAYEAVSVRLRRAGTAALLVWMGCGIVLFSEMERLHPRYVEGFTPAVAAMLGIGLAWASARRGRLQLGFLAAAMLVTVYYTERLYYGRPGEWWIGVMFAFGAILFALVARIDGPPSLPRRLLAPAGVLALALCAVLTLPFTADLTAIHDHVTDAGLVGALPHEQQRGVSDYVRAHQGGAYYELASESATAIGSLIVNDARPVLVLTTYGSRVFVPVPKLKQLIAEGKVKYAFLNTQCSHHGASLNPACSEPAQWIRAHGTDVSREAGLHEDGVLWRLPGVKP